MDRTFLIAALAALTACPIPNTLGLPCEVDGHCDVGQFCNAQDVCEQGEPDMPPPTMSGPPPTGPMTMPTDPTDASGTGTTDDPSTTATTAAAESSSSTTEAADTSSSGDVCGYQNCTDLDILLIVDNSESMLQWLAPLANSLAALFDLFIERLDPVCSFHIGLANSERMPESNSPECQYAGALLQRFEECGGADGAPSYYSNEDGTAADVFATLQCVILAQGLNGDSDERMLEAMLGALDPANSAEGECNAGFRRPNADLIVLYVSDENDPTPTDEQDTVADLFLEYVDPSRTAFLAAVGNPGNEDPMCEWVPDAEGEGMGTDTPSALSGFLALSGIPLSQQARVDICEDTVYVFDDAFMAFDATCE